MTFQESLPFRPPSPSQEILEPKWCRPDTPCKYGEGDCRGDADCVGDLVCGVDNCDDFVGGMPGSCCAKIAELTETKKFTAAIEVGTWAEWGPWARPRGGWGRHRGRVFWPAHCQGAQGPCMGDVEIEQAKLEQKRSGKQTDTQDTQKC